MEKKIFIDPQADKELKEFPEVVQDDFHSNFHTLKTKGKLEYPNAKKLNSDLFEIRVKINGIYRGFYAYAQSNYIIILHVFQKKTQKTPHKNLKTAHKRLKNYA